MHMSFNIASSKTTFKMLTLLVTFFSTIYQIPNWFEAFINSRSTFIFLCTSIIKVTIRLKWKCAWACILFCFKLPRDIHMTATIKFNCKCNCFTISSPQFSFVFFWFGLFQEGYLFLKKNGFQLP